MGLNQDDPVRLLGKRVAIHSRQGDVVNEGEIIAYTEAPTIIIKLANGSKVSWRADLATLLSDTPE